jgi:hypothetical protein
MVRTPDGIAFLVAQDKGVSALDDFAGEDEVGFTLLDYISRQGGVWGMNRPLSSGLRPVVELCTRKGYKNRKVRQSIDIVYI